jgi:hypothetical protein
LKKTTTSVLHFKGRLTFEGIGVLLNDLKTRRTSFQIRPVVYKKLLVLMIEVLENVLKYSDYFNDFILSHPDYQPEFHLKRDDDGFVLISRNPVRNKDKKALADKIKLINSSNKDDLKKIYRETITNGIFTEKGGAGLGFIEMAKTASGDLEFRFLPAADGYSIFQLTIHITN